MISIETEIWIPKLPRNLWVEVSFEGLDWELQ